MKKIMAVLLMLFLFVIVISSRQLLQAQSDMELRELLLDENCPVACWLGIMPGQTTDAEVLAIFAANNVTYEKKPLGIEGSQLISYRVTAGYTHPLISSRAPSPVMVFVHAGVVKAVSLTLTDVWGFDMLAAFGTPDVIREAGPPMEFGYLAKGMVFTTGPETYSGDGIVVARLLARPEIERIFAENPYPGCTGMSFYCNLQTATPSDTDLSTPQPPQTSSPVMPALAYKHETLADLLTNPACHAACWMGITADMTEVEMLQILDVTGINHQYMPYGYEGTHIFNFYHIDLKQAYTHPLVNTAENDAIAITMTSRIIDGVSIKLQNVTIADMIATFGAPARITQDVYGTRFYYPQQNLTFAAPNDSDLITGATIVSPGVFSPERDSFSLSDMPPCHDASQRCAVATATPLPGTIPQLLISDLVAAPECETTCWLGIAPGTAQADLVAFLQANNIEFDSNYIDGTRTVVSFRVTGGYSHPLLDMTQPDALEIITYDQHVTAVNFKLKDVHLNQVFGAYGAPDRYVDVSGYNVELDYIAPQFRVVIDEQNNHYAAMLSLVRDDAAARELHRASYSDQIQQSLPRIPTATPFPGTPHSPLARLLGHYTDACRTACWLGIMPDFTTEAELINILTAHGIGYQKNMDTLGIGPDSAFYDYTLLTGYLHPLVDVSAERGIIIPINKEGVVMSIILPTRNLPLKHVLDTYGAPDYMGINYNGSVGLGYADGLMLVVDEGDMVVRITLRNAESVARYLQGDYALDLTTGDSFEPFTGCSTPPQACALLTATPYSPNLPG